MFGCNAPDMDDMDVPKRSEPQARKHFRLPRTLDGGIRSVPARAEPDRASSEATNISLRAVCGGDAIPFARGTSALSAVLDRDPSTSGHPVAGLAALPMRWRMPAGPEARGLAGFRRDARRLPWNMAYQGACCARTRHPGIGRPGFVASVVAFFRMAAIRQGVRKRELGGTASNPARVAATGAFMPTVARGALDAAREG